MARPSSFTCFGLVVHGLSLDEALVRVGQNSSAGQQTMIVTANPEILLHARQYPSYWQVLRQADLRLVDGFGLQIAGIVSGTRAKRVPGVELAESLLAFARDRHWKVAFIGGEGREVADRAAWRAREQYPELRIMAEQGGMVDQSGGDDEDGAEARYRLTQFAPDVLLVAFGHPKQEAWIARYAQEFPTLKVIVGVGGTLDYWAGTVKRAPKIFQKLGMEWLWRLVTQPHRWKRIWNAVVVFPLAVIQDRLTRRAQA